MKRGRGVEGRNIRRNGGWMSRLLSGYLRRNARERK